MNAAAAINQQLSYKELQAALKPYKEQGLTGIKLNSKQCVLQDELDRLTAVKEQEQPVTASNSSKLASSNNLKQLTYPFCSNTVKVVNQPTIEETTVKEEPQLFTTKVLRAMDSKYAPSWLCKPMTVYVIDGIEYFSHELEAQLHGQVCELPAVTNERKLQANQPPRLQTTARKDRVSKARQPQPIVIPAKELPKVAVTFKAQEDYNPYFIDTAKAARYTKGLGTTELQAARNLQDAVSATKQGLKNVINFAKGFHARQVERAMKAA